MDITIAPLPPPTVTLAPASPVSLFAARNLGPVASRLATRFGSHGLIIQLAIYPGEIEGVIGGSGQARAASATSAGAVRHRVPLRACSQASRSGGASWAARAR